MDSRAREGEGFRARREITDRAVRALPGLHNFGRKKLNTKGSADGVSR
jgi:hypothetical protein